MRPQSIETFEKVYLGAIVIGIVNTVLSWSQVDKMMNDPRIQAAGVGTGTLIFGVFVGLLIPLLLWYFIARRSSSVAKWIYVVLTALGLFGFLSSLANPLVPKGLVTALGAVAVVLQVFGAWLLLRSDAMTWLDDPFILAVGVIGLVVTWFYRPSTDVSEALLRLGQGRDFQFAEPVFLTLLAVFSLLTIFFLVKILRRPLP